jgi:hypothetical protein
MMILSKPKQLEILKTILVNRILMVFQNQPMLGNVLHMACGGFRSTFLSTETKTGSEAETMLADVRPP